jgi:hypothetical protein
METQQEQEEQEYLEPTEEPSEPFFDIGSHLDLEGGFKMIGWD